MTPQTPSDRESALSILWLYTSRTRLVHRLYIELKVVDIVSRCTIRRGVDLPVPMQLAMDLRHSEDDCTLADSVVRNTVNL